MTTRPTFVRVGERAFNLDHVIYLRYDRVEGAILIVLVEGTTFRLMGGECAQLLAELRRLEVMSWPDAP